MGVFIRLRCFLIKSGTYGLSVFNAKVVLEAIMNVVCVEDQDGESCNSGNVSNLVRV